MAVELAPGAVRKAVFTEDDLYAIQGATGKDYELVRGELYEVAPPTGMHGLIQGRLGSQLIIWSDDTDAGYVFIESGYKLESDPDTVRGPDVSFVAKGRIPEEDMMRGAMNAAPDFAAEIRSPNDTWRHLEEKAHDYFAAGTKLVLFIEMRKFGELIRPNGERKRLEPDDYIEADDVLPGFRCRLRDLFPKANRA
jgi:Uma2 family endonuclease